MTKMLFLSETKPCAKKHYPCNASEFWHDCGMSEEDLTPDQRLFGTDPAKADQWKILPGQVYIKQAWIIDGELTTYRARPGMHAICIAYDLFDEN